MWRFEIAAKLTMSNECTSTALSVRHRLHNTYVYTSQYISKYFWIEYGGEAKGAEINFGKKEINLWDILRLDEFRATLSEIR